MVERALPLTWPGSAGSGLILNAEICNGEIYMLAPALKTIHVADLSSGIVGRHIGNAGNGPEDLRRPVSFGLDCANGRVYVVEGPGGVVAFSLADGRYENSYPHTAQFRPSMGVRTFVLGGGSRLLLSGLWSSQVSRSWQTGDQMFKNTKLGLSLPLDEELARRSRQPMMPAAIRT